MSSGTGALITAPQLDGWDHAVTGKVRELYVPAGQSPAEAREVLVLATDRISAFDFSLQPGIPDKGRVLTQLSLLWFELVDDLVEHHVISADDVPAQVRGRALRCRGLDMLPLECIVRGYLTGSGLADYRATGTVGGHALPAGLEEASPLPEPILTPSTKAEAGGHDENITVADAFSLVGEERGREVEQASLAVYQRAAQFARDRSIIVADTKFEFGLDRDTGALVLGDEVLTPDSSRFWDAHSHRVGVEQNSFDKQFVRNWLTSAESGWDRTSGQEPPELPEQVVEQTREKYIEAFERLSGRRFV